MISSDGHTSDRSFRGDAAIITSTMLWGLGTVVMKNVLGDTPDKMHVFVFNGIRLPIGVLFLFATEKIMGRRIALKREHFLLVAVISLIGALNSLFFLFGLNLTTATNTGIITATVPLFILIAAFVSRIERPTLFMIIGVVVGFFGALGITYQGGTFEVNPGDILIVTACAFMAVFTVMSKKILESYSPMTTAAWIFLFIFVYQLPFFIRELPAQSWSSISLWTWVNFAVAVIGPLYIANSFYYYAVHALGPSRVGSFNYLTPVFTLLFAFLISGEKVSLLQVAGLVVIITGIAITRKGAARRPPFRV